MSGTARETEYMRVKGLNFDLRTTTNIDYQPPDVRSPTKTVYQERKVEPKRVTSAAAACVPLKHVETMKAYTNKHGVPFDLYIKKNAILHEDPRAIIMPVSKLKEPEDQDFEMIRRTRPRVTITPQINIDDCSGDIYDLIVKKTYTSEYMQTNQEAGHVESVGAPAPLIGKYSPTMPLALPSLQLPYVSPEWRMTSVSWDRRRRSNHLCDPTFDFWQSFRRKMYMDSNKSGRALGNLTTK